MTFGFYRRHVFTGDNCIHHRLLDRLDAPADWVSGDRHWLVAAVGGEQAVAMLMAQLQAGPFAEVQLAMGVAPGQDGQVMVVRLGEAG